MSQKYLKQLTYLMIHCRATLKHQKIIPSEVHPLMSIHYNYITKLSAAHNVMVFKNDEIQMFIFMSPIQPTASVTESTLNFITTEKKPLRY